MTQATINDNTYSDDGTSNRDMLHGGHRTWFLPMVGDVATVAGVVAGQAAQTAIDAASAADMAGSTRGTSTTSITVSAGTKTLSTQAGKQFAAGNYVTISRTSAPPTMMHGIVASYSGTAMVVEVAVSAGSGTYTDWTIALSGPQGATGTSGDGSLSYLAKTGAYTITAADKAKLIDCTSGTFPLSFQDCATLGATWATWIKNSGIGVVTLDPDGAETINGGSTYLLYPSHAALVTCDGSALRVVQDVGPRQVRLPIFSAAAASMEAVSALEDIGGEAHSTLLPASTGSNIIFGNSLFIVSSLSASSYISSSPDGATWTLRAMPSSAAWSVGTNGTDKFVAVANGGTATAKSTDGVTWTSGGALPGNSASGYSRPVFIGSVCLVRSTTANLCYLSSDNGATWSSAQTVPSSMQGHVFSIGGLFWAYTGGATAYTSPTGLTGSWTLRSLPISPSFSYTIKSLDGALTIIRTDYGTPSYETDDGINWEATGFVSAIGAISCGLKINGVMYWGASTFPEAKTYHNGKFVQRISMQNNTNIENYFASSGSIVCFSNGSGVSSDKIARLNLLSSEPSAIFEG